MLFSPSKKRNKYENLVLHKKRKRKKKPVLDTGVCLHKRKETMLRLNQYGALSPKQSLPSS